MTTTRLTIAAITIALASCGSSGADCPAGYVCTADSDTADQDGEGEGEGPDSSSGSGSSSSGGGSGGGSGSGESSGGGESDGTDSTDEQPFREWTPPGSCRMPYAVADSSSGSYRFGCFDSSMLTGTGLDADGWARCWALYESRGDAAETEVAHLVADCPPCLQPMVRYCRGDGVCACTWNGDTVCQPNEHRAGGLAGGSARGCTPQVGPFEETCTDTTECGVREACVQRERGPGWPGWTGSCIPL